MNEDKEIQSKWTREQTLNLIKRTNNLIKQEIDSNNITKKMIDDANNDVRKIGKLI